MEGLTLSLQFHNIFLFQLLIAHDALLRGTNKRVCTCFAGNMRAGLHHCRQMMSETRTQRKVAKSLPYMRELFDNVFLQDGHMGSASSFLAFSLLSPGVESTERAELPPLKNVNLTGIRCFMLWK